MSEALLRTIFCVLIFLIGYGFIAFIVDTCKLIKKLVLTKYFLYSVSAETFQYHSIMSVTYKNRLNGVKTCQYKGTEHAWYNHPTGELCGYELSQKLMKYERQLIRNDWKTIYFNTEKFNESEMK